MTWRHKKLIAILTSGVGVLLPFLLGVLFSAQQSLQRATAQEFESTPVAEDWAPPGEPGSTGSPGWAVDTSTFPPAEEELTDTGDAPLGTEMSLEELEGLKQQEAGWPPFEAADPQADPYQ